jgi:hypothetical protein
MNYSQLPPVSLSQDIPQTTEEQLRALYRQADRINLYLAALLINPDFKGSSVIQNILETLDSTGINIQPDQEFEMISYNGQDIEIPTLYLTKSKALFKKGDKGTSFGQIYNQLDPAGQKEFLKLILPELYELNNVGMQVMHLYQSDPIKCWLVWHAILMEEHSRPYIPPALNTQKK